MDIKTVASAIILELKARGFILHRYNAYSTKSVYIKLDYGVCYSIRISDHDGKKYLHYRYNIINGVKNRTETGTHPAFYFDFNSLDELLKQIDADKAGRINQYGLQSYKNFMVKNKNDAKNKDGFWKQAVEV